MSASTIIVQFSMTKGHRIPAKVPYKEAESTKDSTTRRARCAAGAESHIILEPTEQCAVRTLADNLYDAGYQMVDVWRQVRQHQNGRGMYHTLRYTFVKDGDARRTLDELREWYPEVEDDFIGLVEEVFWRARAFLNPGENGTSLLSLNLEVAVPRYSADGKKEILARRKDADGKPTGVPVPIEPLATLRLNQDLTISVEQP